MGVNLVIVDGNTKIDLTTDTVTAGTLKKGATAHNAAGDVITGTLEAEGLSIERETNSGGGETVIVTGEEILDTSDATATASDIASGKTAYAAGEKITGTMNKDEAFIAYIESDYGSGITSLPESVTRIGAWVFSSCGELTLTSLPVGVTTIGDYAFSGCTNLALTSLPAGVTSIGGCAFYNCPNLTLTSLPAGVTSIGFYAFGNSTGLTSLTFKGTPTTIHSNAFYECSNLTDIYVPWSEGAVANAPWGATNATIHYNSAV